MLELSEEEVGGLCVWILGREGNPEQRRRKLIFYLRLYVAYFIYLRQIIIDLLVFKNHLHV